MFLSAEIPTQRYNNISHDWRHSGRGLLTQWVAAAATLLAAQPFNNTVANFNELVKSENDSM